ncbi:MMPL family protein [compost metagenome]
MVHLRNGLPLAEAYARSLYSTGKVVALVGFTLAIGVITWVLSPIKFQADMGLLLSFMFLFNMIGALVMVPALSYFLLGKKTADAAPTDVIKPAEGCGKSGQRLEAATF